MVGRTGISDWTDSSVQAGFDVGMVPSRAGDICAQRFNHADNLFNGLASLGEIATLLLDLRNSQQCGGFSAAGAYELEDRQSFVELLQRLLRLSQRLIDLADAIDDRRRSATRLSITRSLQRLALYREDRSALALDAP